MDVAVRDYLQIHLVVLAWGLTAILGRLIEVPAVEVVVWRTGIAALGFGLAARVWGVPLRVERRDALRLLGTGLLIGWHWVLFFLSARLATASIALAAMPTAMLWCSLMEPLVDGSRKWRPGELVVGGVMVGAVWLIYQVELSHWWGFTVGLAAAVLAAVFSVINKQLVKQWHGLTIGAYQMAGAFAGVVVALPWMAASGEAWLQAPSAIDWLWLTVLAVVCTVGAYLGYMDALKRVSVFTINVIYNMEPVYGIVLATLVFGAEEVMSAGFYAGAAIIVGVVVGLPWVRRWLKAA